MDFFDKVVKKVEKKIDKLTGKKPKTRSGGAKDSHGKVVSNTEFANEVKALIHGDVRMFSGCKDEQTSADVSNVASFGLPKVSELESAGGACTNALLSTINKTPQISYGNLLVAMQRLLKEKRYTQVPQLSSSRQVDLKNEMFTVKHPQPNGRTRALLIGINYHGQKGELSGCINDVKMMKNFITHHGFNDHPNHMRIITDDREGFGMPPTAKNIIEGMRWLVEGAAAGDSLFMHYSGHGGQLPDDNGDEADGFDETLVPVDYVSAGQIRDDLIFKLLVAPLVEGVRLLCVFDCCHSGTILDLPFEFSATDGGVNEIQAGNPTMKPNDDFSLAAAIAMIAEVARGLIDGGFAEVSRTLKHNARGLF